MTVLGMDIEQVEQLASSMQQHGAQIDDSARVLTQQIDSTQWMGQDNQTFRSDWDSIYRVQLNNIVQALNDRSAHLKQEAAQQQQASGS
jgi:hypothetical protein